jgi:hypothetical protein
VVESAYDMQGLGNDNLYCIDPIHPIEPVYQSLTASFVKLASGFRNPDQAEENKRMRHDSGDSYQLERRRLWESKFTPHGEDIQGTFQPHSRRPHESKIS